MPHADTKHYSIWQLQEIGLVKYFELNNPKGCSRHVGPNSGRR